MSQSRSARTRRLPIPDAILEAATRSAAALSSFVEEPVSMTPRSVSEWPTTRLPYLLGRPDTRVLGVYLGFEGDLDGHIVLLLRRNRARHLVMQLLGNPTEEDENMVNSALGEVGNITVSSFLGALADRRQLDLRPTPPIVVDDLAGAILDAIVADVVGDLDSIMTIEVDLNWGGIRGGGTLLIIPRPSAETNMFHVLGNDP